jgi:hypothetical protein
MAFFPGQSSKNLGLDLGLEKEVLDEVAHLECVVVDLEYRGHQLQQKMGDILIQNLKNQGKVRYLMATVSPYNPYSLSNLMSMGLFITGLKEKYHHVLRYILLKDIKDNRVVANQEMITLSGEAISEQRLLLEKGYVGKSLDRIQNEIWIHYVKAQ